MKKESELLVEDIKIYSDGLILALEKGRIQESLNYVNNMMAHLEKVRQYLEVKKSIPEN